MTNEGLKFSQSEDDKLYAAICGINTERTKLSTCSRASDDKQMFELPLSSQVETP